VSSLSAILAVESRHDAFFLLQRDQVPNPRSFDTGIGMIWAHNLARQYIVPGLCIDDIPLPVLPTLQAQINPPSQQSGTTSVSLSWDATEPSFKAEAGRPLTAVWINQLSVPVYTNISMDGSGNSHSDIPAGFTGQTFLAITSQQPQDGWDVELVTLAGPTLMEIF
jgi:hypothetical protein